MNHSTISFDEVNNASDNFFTKYNINYLSDIQHIYYHLQENYKPVFKPSFTTRLYHSETNTSQSSIYRLIQILINLYQILIIKLLIIILVIQ